NIADRPNGLSAARARPASHLGRRRRESGIGRAGGAPCAAPYAGDHWRQPTTVQALRRSVSAVIGRARASAAANCGAFTRLHRRYRRAGENGSMASPRDDDEADWVRTGLAAAEPRTVRAGGQ